MHNILLHDMHLDLSSLSLNIVCRLAMKQLLAEAIGIEKLTKSILGTNDNNHNHYVGAAELNLLAQRMQSIEGAPFTSEELQYRFRQGKTQNLVHLADVVRRLYTKVGGRMSKVLSNCRIGSKHRR